MILGVGNDVIEIDRVRRLVEGKLGTRFLERVLTAKEQQLGELRQAKKYEFVAGRFAAKEAVVKAFGCGIGELVGFQDIEIMPDAQGKPICSLSTGAMERTSLSAKTTKVHISISHSKTLASAFAVVEVVKHQTDLAQCD